MSIKPKHLQLYRELITKTLISPEKQITEVKGASSGSNDDDERQQAVTLTLSCHSDHYKANTGPAAASYITWVKMHFGHPAK